MRVACEQLDADEAFDVVTQTDAVMTTASVAATTASRLMPGSRGGT
jgi:hypothetical protein